VKRVSKKDNANHGREFFTCARSACNYFKWVDDAPSDGGVGVGRAPASAFDLVLYTDGGCKGNQNVAHVVNPAGWGVVVVGGGAGESDVAGAAAPLAELYGPVVTDPSDAFHLGAAVCSNNTGELTAIGEALLWLRDGAGEHVRCACAAAAACTCRPCAVSIRYDSNYAAKSVMGEFNGEKNKPLITAIRRVYDALRCPGGASACAVARGTPRRRPVVFTWTKVKAHSGDRWNERADQLASLGIQGQVCAVGRYRQDVKRAAAAPVVVVVDDDDDDDNDDGDDGPCPKKQRVVDY
jgi:ribonuclease HI